MPKTPLLTALALLLLPSAAAAATVTAHIDKRHGTNFGPITFNAAPGEINGVVVTQANGRLRFHERLQRAPIEARGDCDQVNANIVSCPTSEDIAKVKLGDRADIAQVEGLVEVFGGPGVDFLFGSAGSDDLDGGGGQDKVSGRGGPDELTGGPGSDVVKGGTGDDDLIDGERDGNAQPDRFVGGSSRDTAGSDRGDLLVYAARSEALRVDLLGNDKGPDRDKIKGIESVEGGAGDDTLIGDGDDNHLVGNGGDDSLRGGRGDDFLGGELGDDRLWSGRGDNVLNGGEGVDSLEASSGDDDLVANDATAEALDCGAGEDIARTTALDTVEDCEVANSDPFYFQVQPEISGNTATFQVACQQLGGCDGELALRGPQGEAFGSGAFSDLPDDPETFSPVTVNLTDAAVAALADGVVVEVLHSETGGYRAFMQSG